MCGVAGAVGPDAAEISRRMTAALVHRGPDDEGHLLRDNVALGFRRLSIIDVDGGNQPISNENEDVHLVCNGEIYNSPELRKKLEAAGHRFRTRTDVEVILHLYEEYGEDCVSRLRGMFAFAIHDERDGSILLAKDHMGQKPLFFAESRGHFLFASEIHALLASDTIRPDINFEGLWHYLSLRCLPGELSLIRNVRKLPAASTLRRTRNGGISVRRYWTPEFREKFELSERDAVDALEEKLRATVRSHELSDVPIGAFLSGGIDSSTIAAMMARDRSEPLPVFSIGVENASFDELPVAERIAQAKGMAFFGERVHADIASLIPLMVYHLAEPADPYAVGVYLVSRLASRHVKVALSGDGGDESFAGYDRYYGHRLAELYGMLPAGLRKRVLRPLIDKVPETFRYKSLSQRLHWLDEMSDLNGGQRYARALGVLRFPTERKQRLLSSRVIDQLGEADSDAKVLAYFNAENVDDLIDRMLYTDLMTRVTDHNLVMNDRMSMACSLEVRSPFVDPDLIEFAARLPARFKMKGRKLKYLLRRVAERYIPRDIARMPKQGFGFPVGQWMRRDLAPLLQDRLRKSGLAAADIFEQVYIDSLLDEHLSGKLDHSYRLWLLLCLEFWFDIYIRGADVTNMQQATAATISGQGGTGTERHQRSDL